MATFEITTRDEKIQDLLQSDRGMAALLEPILNQLLQAEMTEHLRAEPGERTDQRCGWRNGSYKRRLTTRVGRLELEVPRDREGTFQTSLFERYQHAQKSLRVEKALVLALMQMVNVDLMRSTQGVSTRRIKKITTDLCGREFTGSNVSRLSEGLDEQVTAWAERPLEGRSYPFLVLDAMQVKVRRQGAVRSTTVLLAVGINEAGHRELLGLEVAFGETGEAWRRFIRGLKGRGLSGVVAQKFLRMATSDAHKGLRQALEAAFPGLIWHRCHTEEFLGVYFRRNVMDRTPAGLRDQMHELLDRILTAPSPERAREAVGEACAELEGQADKALEVLETGWEEATAVLVLPPKYRRRLRTTNMLERFIEEIRRREKVIRIFHRRNTCVRTRPTASSVRSVPSGTRNSLGPGGATSRWRRSSSGRRLSNPTATRYR
jgi:transposase-like protein